MTKIRIRFGAYKITENGKEIQEFLFCLGMPAHEGAGKTGKTALVFQPDASVNGWMAGRKIRGYHGFPSVWQPGSYAGGTGG